MSSSMVPTTDNDDGFEMLITEKFFMPAWHSVQQFISDIYFMELF